MIARERRRAYLEATGRIHTLIAEGFIQFGVHEGGRGRYTPMAELSALCQETIWPAESEDDPAELDSSPGPSLKEQVAVLRAKGMLSRQIAEDLRIPPSTVRKYIRASGLSKPWKRGVA